MIAESKLDEYEALAYTLSGEIFIMVYALVKQVRSDRREMELAGLICICKHELDQHRWAGCLGEDENGEPCNCRANYAVAKKRA